MPRILHSPVRLAATIGALLAILGIAAFGLLSGAQANAFTLATSGTGPVLAQGTITDLCLGIAGPQLDHVYAEEGRDAGISGTCGTNTVQLAITADPSGYEIVAPGTSASADLVSVVNPGNVIYTDGQSVNLPLSASSSVGHPVSSWTATGLPAGLSINGSTGVITGTVTTSPGTYVVTTTATDSANNAGSATFEITVDS